MEKSNIFSGTRFHEQIPLEANRVHGQITDPLTHQPSSWETQKYFWKHFHEKPQIPVKNLSLSVTSSWETKQILLTQYVFMEKQNIPHAYSIQTEKRSESHT